MPKFCPCTSNLSRSSFSFYLLLIDMIIGFPTGIMFLLSLLCVLIYLR